MYDRCNFVFVEKCTVSYFVSSALSRRNLKQMMISLFLTILLRAQVEMRMVRHPKCRKTLFVITVTEHLGVDTI